MHSQNTYELLDEGGMKNRCKHLNGKRVGLVVLSNYPFDPRPRRTADLLRHHKMSIDYICLSDGKAPSHERINGIDVFRVPIKHKRGGKFAYAWQYSAFILAAGAILTARSLRHRYDLIYINNMPDVLVASALLPKVFGAKVILDLHDPMPELMMTIFGTNPHSKSIRFLKVLEKWSMERADQILTPNIAFKRIFAARSCPEQKIAVIMNSPDGAIFSFQPACSPSVQNRDRDQPFVVMYHGTLVERNGLDVAVQAFGHIHAKLPTAKLHIYGKPTPFLERVMQSARERGLQQSVLHLGEKPLEQIVEAIDGCDVGVVPNPRNAFTEINMPTRIFEYLSRGKPVIAPRTAGIQDYFDEHSLLFFEPGNAEDLARTIQFVACNPEEACRITDRGQQVFKAHSWEQEGHMLLRVVEQLLEPKTSNS
jgi:glycosyltransferase involved in cell wall biosynthesis